MSLLRNVQEEILTRLARVSVTARHAVESVLVGQHRSLHRGLSVEFAGHRRYQAGDDLRHLDWQVYARSDRYDIRLYEEETRLRATLVVDASGSMGFTSSDGTRKLDYARSLAAALAVLMVRQGDAVGLATVDTAVRRHVPPGSTMGRLIQMLNALEDDEPGGETALGPVLEGLAERLDRRGLVLLITDGLDDPARFATALSHLHHRKQDVRVFQVLAPEEEAFAFRGTWEFVGMEREASLRLDADRLRHRYRAALAEHRRQLAAACHAAGVALVSCTTDEDPALVLVRALGGDAQGASRR